MNHRNGLRFWAVMGKRDVTVLAAAAGVTAIVVFVVWEYLEHTLVPTDSFSPYVHLERAVSATLLTALIVAWLSYKQHQRRVVRLEDRVRERTREATEARSMLQLLVDTTPAALLVLDKQFKVVSANKTAERVHGADLMGRYCFEAIHGKTEKCNECRAGDLFGKASSGEFFGEHRDASTGEILRVEAHPLKVPTGEDQLLLVGQVVTEQKKLEARLVHREKMVALGLMSAGIAHEIGNPLSSIGTQLQLLDTHSLSADAEPIISTVKQELSRLDRTVRELTNFARRRGGENTLVSVQSVVRDAIRLLRHDRRMRGVQVVEEFDSETPSVHMVEDHLMQVVINILINALLAMPKGGTLGLGLRPVDDWVELSVKDCGVGMESSVLDVCFDPFFTTREGGDGAGLGLSISKDLIEAAGGRIEIRGVPEKGTTVFLTLPRASTDSPLDRQSVRREEVV